MLELVLALVGVVVVVVMENASGGSGGFSAWRCKTAAGQMGITFLPEP